MPYYVVAVETRVEADNKAEAKQLTKEQFNDDTLKSYTQIVSVKEY